MGWLVVFARLPQRLILLLSVAALLPVAWTTATVVPANAATPTVLRVGLTQDIDTLNPFEAELASSTDIGRVMYEFLTTYAASDEHPVPGLATAWKQSPDGLTWTYTIRNDAKWSDGQPITADDAAFTFNLMMTNKDAATANGNFVANFASVTAPNPTTLVITTKAPQATMLALDVPIVPRHVWSGVSDIAKYTNLPTAGHPVVGSGPYLLSDYREGQFVKLVANNTYWRGAPKIDELDFVHFDDTNSEVQALLKGDIDLVNGLTAAEFDSLKGHAGITTNQAVGGRFVDLVMNSGAATNTNQPIGDGNPNLKDIALRTAIAQAIDPQTLVDKVYGGFAQVGTGYIPDKFATYHWNPAPQQARKFDPNAANKALDAAGYPKGADGIRTGKDGKPLNLRLIGRTDKPEQTQMAAYVKSWLGAIGIGVDVQMVSSSKLDDVTSAGDFDLAFSGWGVDPDPDAVLALQTCDQRPDSSGQAASTEAFFCDPAYDTLYHQQLTDMNPTTRVGVVKQLESVFYQRVPEVTLLYPNVLEAYRSDRFAPFDVQPQPGGVIMAQNGYWGYYSATPVAAAAASGSGGGTGLIVAIVVIGGLIAFTMTRRRTRAADRE